MKIVSKGFNQNDTIESNHQNLIKGTSDSDLPNIIFREFYKIEDANIDMSKSISKQLYFIRFLDFGALNINPGIYTLSFKIFIKQDPITESQAILSDIMANSYIPSATIYKRVDSSYGGYDIVTIGTIAVNELYCFCKNKWLNLSLTFELETEDVGKIDRIALAFTDFIKDPTKQKLYITDLKLENGYTATEWCKAIDDVKFEPPADMLIKPRSGEFMIPTTGWVASGNPSYPYKIKIPIPNSSINDMINCDIDLDHHSIAENCNLYEVAEILEDGYCTFHAQTIPTAQMRVYYLLLRVDVHVTPKGTITVPTVGWVDSLDTGEYKKKYLYRLPGIRESDYIFGSVSMETNDFADIASLDVVKPSTDYLTFYAKQIPTGNIVYEYHIIKAEPN